ncbi:hypothetical protein PoB_007429900, partial [Plakobranchus ocellatus]
MISGFQALRQARASVAGLEPATEGSLQSRVTSTESKSKRNPTDNPNNSIEGESDVSGRKRDNIGNGYEEEDEDSDFENISDVEVPTEISHAKHQPAKVSEIISATGKEESKDSVEKEDGANNISKQNTKKKVERVKARNGTNDLAKKFNRNSRNTAGKTTTISDITNGNEGIQNHLPKKVMAQHSIKSPKNACKEKSKVSMFEADKDFDSSSSENDIDMADSQAKTKARQESFSKLEVIKSQNGPNIIKTCALSKGETHGAVFVQNQEGPKSPVSEESSLFSLSSDSEDSTNEVCDLMSAQISPVATAKSREMSLIESQADEQNKAVMECDNDTQNDTKASLPLSGKKTGDETNGRLSAADKMDTEENESAEADRSASLLDIFSFMSVVSPLSPMSTTSYL